jgi:DNA-binding NarL/FixJ family response regulator
MKLRIVVADDNPAFLNEFVSILETQFDVVATARDGKSALETILSYHPDVAVLDLDMPGLNGIEVARKVTKSVVGVEIVICSVESDPEIIEAAFRAGVLGYVFKTRIVKDLIEAVKSAARGNFFRSSPD